VFYSEYQAERTQIDDANIPPLLTAFKNDSISKGVQLGVTGQINSALNYNILAGKTAVDISRNIRLHIENSQQPPYFVDRQTQNETNDLYLVDLTYQGERLHLKLSASEQLMATGNGVQLATQQWQISGNRQLTQLQSLSVSMTYNEQSEIDRQPGESKPFDRQYSQAGITYNYKFSRFWIASLSTTYLNQIYDNSPDHAEAYGGAISLRYTPTYIVW
jgi:hypothetical protein